MGLGIDYGERRFDDLPESDVYKTSIFGFKQQLEQFFPGKTTEVVLVPNGIAPLRALIKKRGSLAAKTKPFPFFAFTLLEAADNRTSYNYFALHRRGVTLRAAPQTGNETTPAPNSSPQFSLTRAHISPLTQTIQVSFITNNALDLYGFTPRWLDCSRYHYLSFQIYAENDVAPAADAKQPNDPEGAIDIRVDIDQQVSYPDLEMDDVGEMFIIQATATMQTYDGVITKKLSVSRVNTSFIVANQHNEAPTLANFEQRNIKA